MSVKLALAAACAMAGLYTSEAQASILLSSTSGTIISGSQLYEVQGGIGTPDGYTRPARPEQPFGFTGAVAGPDETYEIVLNTQAVLYADLSAEDIEVDQEIWYQINGSWFFWDGLDTFDDAQSIYASHVGDNYIWTVTEQMSASQSYYPVGEDGYPEVDLSYFNPYNINIDAIFDQSPTNQTYTLSFYAYPTPMPEPSTWLLLIIGTATTGAAIRSERRRGVVAFG